jgi:hypothetical protein
VTGASSEGPSLAQFFHDMGSYLSDPSPGRVGELRDLWSGRDAEWEGTPERIGIYGGHSRFNVYSLLEKLYDGCMEVLEEEVWDRVLADFYRTRPSRDRYEINSAAKDFPEFLRGRDDVAEFVPDLAQFEWTLFEIYSTAEVELPAEEPERLIVNPTLVTLEMSWRLCPYYTKRPCSGEPERADNVAFVWRNHRTLFANYRTADPSALLAVKIALEGITPAQAAEEGGVSPEQVLEVLREHRDTGLVLGPL